MKRMSIILVVLLAVSLVLQQEILADKLYLKNGDIITGTIIRTDEFTVQVETDLGIITVARDKIAQLIYEAASAQQQVMSESQFGVQKKSYLAERGFEIHPYAGGLLIQSDLFDDPAIFGARLMLTLANRLSLEGTFGFGRSARFLNQAALTAANTDSIIDTNYITYRGDLIYHLTDGRVRPFLLAGAGVFTFDDVGNGTLLERAFVADVGGGLKINLGESFAFRGDVRDVIVASKDLNLDGGSETFSSRNNVEVSGGVTYAFNAGSADTDNDGVDDSKDSCPGTPFSALVDFYGCPIDSDSDGVADGIDRCPSTQYGAAVRPDGCPYDADGDGTYDGLDQCPNTPPGMPVDGRGCPPDSDADGITDDIDRCPDTPFGVAVDGYGCQTYARTIPGDTSDSGRVLSGTFESEFTVEGVHFERNSINLTPDSFAALDEIANQLLLNPSINIEVGAYTDNLGSETGNREISQKRANSVRNYLVASGIDESRLSPVGYGSENPIGDNSTEQGRMLNRRVVIRRIE